MRGFLAALAALWVLLAAAADYGVVESVRVVTNRDHPPELAEVFEHAINPESAQELVVRLDDERIVTLVHDGEDKFTPGERVVIVHDGIEARAAQW